MISIYWGAYCLTFVRYWVFPRMFHFKLLHISFRKLSSVSQTTCQDSVDFVEDEIFPLSWKYFHFWLKMMPCHLLGWVLEYSEPSLLLLVLKKSTLILIRILNEFDLKSARFYGEATVPSCSCSLLWEELSQIFSVWKFWTTFFGLNLTRFGQILSNWQLAWSHLGNLQMWRCSWRRTCWWPAWCCGQGGPSPPRW